MFDIAIEFLTSLFPMIPFFICLILVFNIISDLLWGK